MVYSFYQLLWLYMIYSFIGWCAEVVVAAVKRHRFVNRGAVSGPFCPIYGLGAVVVAVFLPELKRKPVFSVFWRNGSQYLCGICDRPHYGDEPS